MDTMWVASVDIHRRLGVKLFFPQLSKMGPIFFLMAMHQSVMLSCLPADGLFLISDACLPECTIGLFQAKSDCSLQVIFIIPSQVNHIYTNTKIWEDTSYTFMVYTERAITLFTSLKWLCLSMMSVWFYLLKHKKTHFLRLHWNWSSNYFI